MNKWKNTLYLAPMFHSEEMTLHQKTVLIIERIKSRPWYERLYYLDDMESMLEELADAGEADDVEWWDSVWDAMYDIFDAERVWVTTR